MPYSTTLTINQQEVIFCACETPADGLFRGATLHPESDRVIPMNRYLCVQCAQDNRDLRLKTRRVKGLVYSQGTWDAIEEMYNKATEKGLDLFAYFDQYQRAKEKPNRKTKER